MLKKLVALGAVVSVLAMSSAFSVVPDGESEASMGFKSIGKELRAAGKITEAAELLPILQKVHGFAVANKDVVPSFMEAGTEMFADYQKGMDEFIAAVDSAIALAEKGDSESTKAAMKEFSAIKDKFHEHFNLEEE